MRERGGSDLALLTKDERCWTPGNLLGIVI